LVEGQGIPIAITIDGANRHDMKMTRATLQSIVVCRPPPSSSKTNIHQQQHICLDKGYDYPEVYELRNMVIPSMFVREEKTIIIVTKKRREEGYQNIEQEDG